MGTPDELDFSKIRIQLPDGTVIEDEAAVRAHFEKEKALSERYGPTLFFELYRLDLSAKTMEDLVGPRVETLELPGASVSGDATTAAVKADIRQRLSVRQREQASEPLALELRDVDSLTLWFNGRPMVEERLFYADHMMMLPAWIQVWVHECETNEVMTLGRRLSQQRPSGAG